MRTRLEDHPTHQQAGHDGDAEGPQTAQDIRTDRGPTLIWVAVAAVVTILVGLTFYGRSVADVATTTVAEQSGGDDVAADGYTGDWKDEMIGLQRQQCEAALPGYTTYSGDWKDTMIALELGC